MKFLSLKKRVEKMDLSGVGIVNISSLLVSCLYDEDITINEFNELLKLLTIQIDKKG